MKMNTENKLILLTSNKTNMKLYGWESNCIGKTLYELMEPEHADRWQKRYFDWKKIGITTYMSYFDDSLLGWQTTIEIYNDLLFGIGKKVYKKVFDGNEFFNHYYIQQEDFLTIVVRQESNSFIIDSINTSLLVDLSSFIENDISSLTYFSSNILDKNVYFKCLNHNKIIHYVENIKLDNECLYFDVYLYPFNKSKVLICARNINEENYFKILSSIHCLDEDLEISKEISTCQINYQSKNNPYIIGCNNTFKKLLEDTTLCLETILSNETFQNSFKSKSKKTGKIVLHNKFNEQQLFDISVDKVCEFNKCNYIIKLSPDKIYREKFDKFFSILSPREKQIILLVTEGNTNRYISNKLSIAEGTVKKTIYTAFKKIGINSRIELLKLIYND